MTTSNFTTAQKKGLFVMLRDQQSQMTQSEKELYEILLKEFRNCKDEFLAEIVTFEGIEFYKCGKFVKQTEIDTFGEDYRNCWMKIQESGKGFFVNPSYIGRRIYLD